MEYSRLIDWLTDRGWLIVLLVSALVVTGYWGYQRQQALNNLETELDSRYAYFFQKMIEELDDLEEELGRMVVGEAPSDISVNLSQAWKSAYAAHTDITQLPLQSDELNNLKRLLMRTKLYVRYLDKEIVKGRLGDENKAMLNKFRQQIQKADAQLEEINDKMAQADFNWYNKRRVKLDKERGSYAGSLVESFTDLNKAIKLEDIDQELKTRIGTEITEETDNLAIQAKTEVQAEEAIETARRFVTEGENYEFELIHGRKFKLEGGRRVTANLPTYSVKGESKTDPETEVYLDVSRQNGEVVLMLKEASLAGENLTETEAREKVNKFLADRGYHNLVPAISEKYSSLLFLSFVPQEEGVLINPAAVTVEVDLDQGEIIAFDSTQNLLNRRGRDKAELEAELSLAAAKQRLNDRFELTESAELVVERINNEEKLCYQFIGQLEAGAADYRVLINAQTGTEEMVEPMEADIYQD